ncbi:MAG: DUF4446 family protein [Patescibacteria group bacterium]
MNTLVLIYILAGIIVILLVWVMLTERRLKKFFVGKKAEDLEELMTDIFKQVENLKKTQLEINSHLITVDSRLDKSIRSVETIRFNPFLDAGSNQSFAISFLNDKGDGVIISSLYARDRMSIFAKPINNGKSEFELSTEEKEVLKKSKDR